MNFATNPSHAAQDFEVAAKTIHSAPSPSGLATILLTQSVDHTQYFDAAGFIGRTVGLKEKKAASR